MGRVGLKPTHKTAHGDSSGMWDTVELTETQRLIQSEIREICGDFSREYWRERDLNNEYPWDFAETLAENGWLGVLLPEKYGGAGMGTPEVMVMMEEIARSGAGFGAAQAIHGAVYTSTPIVKYATDALQEDLLPKLARGEKTLQAFGLTEPNAGSESTNIETFARPDGDHYLINGAKIWTSRVEASDYMLLVARTTPRTDVEKKTEGISLFIVDVADAREAGTLEMQAIPKMSVNMSHSYQLWFEDMRVPSHNLIGEQGQGFYYLLDGLNEERFTVAAESIGVGEVAIDRAAEYATEREVFDRPIGKNQAIQHPLAAAYARLTAAKHLTYNAATMVEDLDRKEVGVMANTAKYLTAEAAFEATDAAVQTHGGFGVAREYDVERYFRDARLARIAPVSQELALSYIAENALALPRSY